MEIRLFEKSDLLKCADLLVRAMNMPPWNEQWTLIGAEKYLGEFVNCTRFVGFIEFDGGNLVGAAFCHEKTWWEGDELYIDEFYIAPEYQSEGYGSSLLRYIENYAAEKSLGSVTLLTKRDIPAFGFYKKNGFADLDQMTFMAKNL